MLYHNLLFAKTTYSVLVLQEGADNIIPLCLNRKGVNHDGVILWLNKK